MEPEGSVGESTRPSDEGRLPEAGGPAGPPLAAPPADPVLAALADLGETLEAYAAQARALGDEVRVLRARRLSGLGWRELLADQGGTGVLGELGRLVLRLTGAGAALRRALAATLVDEGASTAEIAGQFGVSRQRVFRLLQGRDRPLG